MTLKEDRYAMSADRYLAKNCVMVYLEDAISQLLLHREENPKVEPLKYLSQYFSSLRDGNHTMFRDFAFIKSTPHNRVSFVRLFWKCFRHIGKKGDLLSIQEYHSLLGLLCTDFPFALVQKTARIVLIDDALDCLIAFSDFIYAFQVQFYYEEFLDQCGEAYKLLLQSCHSPRDPVIVPTSNQRDTLGLHQNNQSPADGVDSSAFFRHVASLCDRGGFSTPPLPVLKEILFTGHRISFYGFLMSIAKSEAINEHIGRLPPKQDVFEGADIELTLQLTMTKPKPSIKTGSGGRNRPASGSLSQRSASGAPPRAAANQLQSVSATVRAKVSEKAYRIRAQRKAPAEQSDSDDETSSDSSDD